MSCRGCGVVVVPRLGEQAKKEEPSKQLGQAESRNFGARMHLTVSRSFTLTFGDSQLAPPSHALEMDWSVVSQERLCGSEH